MTQNDDTAIGAIQAFEEAGLRVPDDVSVVGFDGTELGELFTPSITSVDVPLREIGIQAMELLLQKIQELPVRVSNVELPSILKIGRSTAPPRA